MRRIMLIWVMIGVFMGILILIVAGAISNVAASEGTKQINPKETFTLGWPNNLEKGATIEWDWTAHDPVYNNVPMTINFWLEYSDGNTYSRQSGSAHKGSFTVPSGGEWKVRWYNPSETYYVSVDYTLSSKNPSTGGGGNTPGFEFLPTLAIIAGVSVVYLIERKRRKL